MNWFSFKGVKSTDFETIMVNQLPHIIKPGTKFERKELTTIQGTKLFSEGYYDNSIRKVECTIKDLSEIDSILSWLNGSGPVIFSNQPDRYYHATIVNEVSFERVMSTFRKFIIEFECLPFGYLESGKTPITLTESGTIVNPGLYESEPVITIFGAGNVDLIVGQQVIQISNINGSITLDTPLLEAYKEAELCNKQVNGEFPTLPIGSFSFNWSGSVTSIVIKPNWRCL